MSRSAGITGRKNSQEDLQNPREELDLRCSACHLRHRLCSTKQHFKKKKKRNKTLISCLDQVLVLNVQHFKRTLIHMLLCLFRHTRSPIHANMHTFSFFFPPFTFPDKHVNMGSHKNAHCSSALCPSSESNSRQVCRSWSIASCAQQRECSAWGIWAGPDSSRLIGN